MDNETTLKLFRKFAGDPLNIYGLLVTPIESGVLTKNFRGMNITEIGRAHV